MSETLFLVKGKNNFGTYAYGVCKVISHKGLVLTEIEPNEFSAGAYRFKVRGASKQIITKSGVPKWQHQSLFCTVKKDSEFAKIAKGLNYGDILDVFGVLKSSNYTTDNGKQRRTSFCNLCRLTVLVKADSEQPIQDDTEETDNEFDDFDDF